MNKKKFDTRLAIEIHSKKLFFAIAAVMLLSNSMLAFFVITADTSEKIVVVPVGFDKPFYIQGEKIDPVYAEQMTRYISQLRWSYTPDTVEHNLKAILRFVSPGNYASLESEWNKEVQEVRRNQISSVFNPDAFRVDMNNNETVIRGDYLAYMGTQIVSRRQRYMRLKMKYHDGRFNLVALREVSGTGFDDLTEIDYKEISVLETTPDENDKQAVPAQSIPDKELEKSSSGGGVATSDMSSPNYNQTMPVVTKEEM